MSKIINNLNFDVEEHFGLGVSAFDISIKNTVSIPGTKLPALIFDASGLVLEIAGRSRNFTALSNRAQVFFDVETSAGDASALSLSTISHPILIQGVIYSVEETAAGFNPLTQFNDAQFNVIRCAIDGNAKQGEEIQPNYTKRNFYYQQDNFVVMKGEMEIDQNTGVVIDVYRDVKVNLTFLVKSIS